MISSHSRSALAARASSVENAAPYLGHFSVNVEKTEFATENAFEFDLKHSV
ncbi:MAG: hypothetical protein BMS9Abin05_0465 [Rhodothermia bacterium]|nr:MAG: hypothetical protein BMS9Abin05_0465 [Rhodothermia bacterium]